jgi:hypothetical protein
MARRSTAPSAPSSPRLPGSGRATSALSGPIVHESVGSTRHAIEPRLSPDEEQRHRFARLVGRIARRDRASGQCDALGIAAPPDLLKDIEAGLGGEAQLGRVRRDLTKTRDEDLPEHLEPVVRTFYRKRRMATAE